MDLIPTRRFRPFGRLVVCVVVVVSLAIGCGDDESAVESLDETGEAMADLSVGEAEADEADVEPASESAEVGSVPEGGAESAVPPNPAVGTGGLADPTAVGGASGVPFGNPGDFVPDGERSCYDDAMAAAGFGPDVVDPNTLFDFSQERGEEEVLASVRAADECLSAETRNGLLGPLFGPGSPDRVDCIWSFLMDAIEADPALGASGFAAGGAASPEVVELLSGVQGCLGGS